MTALPSFALIALAFGLAMDAFAVSVAQGASRRPGIGGALLIGGAFGLAQALMPLLGWGLGVAFASVIQVVDHWIAFVLLGALGAKMIHEGLVRGDDAPPPALIGWPLFVAAIATSIDAAAAGITLPMLGSPIAIACLTIGVITGVSCIVGVWIGAASGARLGKAAEVIGGLVLIGLGTKILVGALFFGE